MTEYSTSTMCVLRLASQNITNDTKDCHTLLIISSIHMTTARSLLIGSKPVKLEYFFFEGVAQRVRIALAITGIPFDDVHITFEEWPEKKPTLRHGFVPEMTLPDGTLITDSLAMLRLVGEADEEGKLYPSDVVKRLKIEQVLGLVGDLTRAWNPPLFVGMRPHVYGHTGDWTVEERESVVKHLRETFLKGELPRFMGYFEKFLKENGGGFMTGEDLTIADLSAYVQVCVLT